MKRDEARRILDVLAAGYPNAKATQSTRNLYGTLLLELDYETASAAVCTVIGELKFWPAFAEIRKAYDEEWGRRVRQHQRDREIEEARARDAAPEPSEEERAAQVAAMREYIASRWSREEDA